MHTLYFAPDNASLVVRIVLEMLETPYRARRVDRASREQDSDSYRRLNPNGLIPVCVIDDEPVFETGAIILLLADQAGRMSPAPTAPGRGRALKWLFFVSNTLHPTLRLLFHPRLLGEPGEAAAAVRLARGRALEAFARLDAAYREGAGPWLPGATPGGGQGPSIVDVYVAICLRWAQLYPVDDPLRPDLTALPGLRRMAEAFQVLPAVARACAAEGIAAPYILDPTPPDGSQGAAT